MPYTTYFNKGLAIGSQVLSFIQLFLVLFDKIGSILVFL